MDFNLALAGRDLIEKRNKLLKDVDRAESYYSQVEMVEVTLQWYRDEGMTRKYMELPSEITNLMTDLCKNNFKTFMSQYLEVKKEALRQIDKDIREMDEKKAAQIYGTL